MPRATRPRRLHLRPAAARARPLRERGAPRWRRGQGILVRARARDPTAQTAARSRTKNHPLIIAWVLRFLELLSTVSQDVEVPGTFVYRFSGF